MSKANLDESLARVADHWSPKVIARVNDSYVKVAKLLGHLVWHKHDEEDELFLVVRGHLRIEYEGERSIDLGPGDMHVVPRGVMHNPVADEECAIVLIEPVSTKHTGDVIVGATKSIDEQLRS